MSKEDINLKVEISELKDYVNDLEYTVNEFHKIRRKYAVKIKELHQKNKDLENSNSRLERFLQQKQNEMNEAIFDIQKKNQFLREQLKIQRGDYE